MGYMRHNLIAVSSFDTEKIMEIHREAKNIFKDTWSTKFSQMVGSIVKSPINNEHTFVIYPDGSKEGWEDSDIADNYRESFVKLIESHKNDDNSNSIRYAEIFYADDEKEVGIEGN